MKPTAKLSFKITVAILATLIKIITRLEIRDRKNLLPDGPIIAVCNHVHLLDPLVHIISILPRDSIFMAKEELFRPWPMPLFAILMRVADALRVPRHGTTEERKEVIEKALTVLAEGHVLGVYPEGTRSITGKMNLAHPGAARLALRSGVPIIPISIYGTEKLKGPGWLTRPKVVVTFGKAFYLPKPDREPSFTRIKELTNQIMGQLCNILPPEYHGEYSKQHNSSAGTSHGKSD